MYMTLQLPRVAALAVALVVSTAAMVRAEGQAVSPDKEARLVAVLQSEAPKADKALACKLLAIDGSSVAVPELAKLLPDEQLSSWARIALEAIPAPEADEALRQATESVQGRLLVGVINSIGVRRDAQAVDVLAKRLHDSDSAVGSAAAVALGHIGGADAAKTLRSSLTIEPMAVRSAVAEGCILCAEQLNSSGNATAAIELYDAVRQGDLPQPRILEATRGAILARGDEGVSLLIDSLLSTDKHVMRMGLTTAREVRGSKVDQALAGELAKATPERAALIVIAMADRPETVVLPAIVKAAGSGENEVRLAAIDALGRVGDASCLDVLLKSAADANAELAQAARESLAELPGEKVDAQIVASLAKAQGNEYPLLIGLVGQRRLQATPALLKALEHKDQTVRAAALAALGETVAQGDLNVLIAQAITPAHADDAEVARRALKAASVRMPDRETCGAELAAAFDKATETSTRISLLEILGAVGGANSLKCVGAAAKSDQPDLQDVSSRLLGGWTTEDAAPVLLDLATTGPNDKLRTRALRGYLRIARQFVLPEEQKLEMCRQAFAAAQQNAERKLVLEVLQRNPSPEALQMAIKAMEVADLKNDASTSVLMIAHDLGAKGIDVRELLTSAGFKAVKLEIVKAEYGVDSTQKDVTAVLRKLITDLPLIDLPSGYNKSFGGDPAPSKVKQLRVQYRIDGKPGEAVFAENAPIILPIPE